METRVVEQFKVFKLVLSPIRKSEGKKNLVAISLSKEELLNWYVSQMAEKVYEGIHPDTLIRIQLHNGKEGAFPKKVFPYRKYFKVGSPIEWYSSLLEPIIIFTRKNIEYPGFYEVWMTQEEFNNEFNYIIRSYLKSVKYNLECRPIPAFVGITPEFLNEIQNKRK